VAPARAVGQNGGVPAACQRHLAAIACAAALLSACGASPMTAPPAGTSVAPTGTARPVASGTRVSLAGAVVTLSTPLPRGRPRATPGAGPTAAPPTTLRAAALAAEPAPPPQAAPATPGPDPDVAALRAMVQGMSLDDEVGQLLLLGFEGGDAAGAAVAIGELRAGGIALLSNATSADAVARLNQDLQALARANAVAPLLIAIDHEGGPVQRITSGLPNLGANWDLGQVTPLEAAVQQACTRGAEHGRELAALGIHMNLAPVLDVWDNPENTVIAHRAYSSDPQVVAQLGSAYIEAMQGAGVLAVGKHFPGHGSSTEDSHLTLPVVRHDRARLDAVELVPFRAAIRANVAAIMLAHVSYPLVDPTPDLPASLSPAIATALLRDELGYQGLVLTDDMGAMVAITGRYEAGDAAVRAVQAGADMLIVVGPVERQRRMAQALRAAVGSQISKERLDAAVERVLVAKRAAGLLPLPPQSLAPAEPVCSPR